ncbi:MAG: glycosyltransferase family 4 protein [Bacteroidetes bacterium]|nr:glycosyltransferase family 4 protein [Bacteroidota bacterium]
MATALSEAGDLNIQVITPSSTDNLLSEKWDKLSIVRFQYWLPQKNQTLAYGKEDTFSNIRRSFWNIFQVPAYLCAFFAKVISNWRQTDIFHCQWTFTAIFPILINKILPFFRKPIIIACRGSDLRLMPGWLNRFFLRNVKAITYGSPLETINRYQEKVGVDILKYIRENTPHGAFCVFDPLDENNLIPTIADLKTRLGYDGKKVILFLGRLDEFKDPIYALRILKELIRRRTDTILLIVGFGPLENEVKNFIKDHALEEFVIFVGPRSDVANYFHMADIFVATSPYEHVWSSTIAEAMMVGCPLVLTDVGNTSKVFTHDFDAMLVPLNQPNHTAIQLNSLLDNPEKLGSLVLNAKKTLNKYRRYEKQTVEDYCNLYEKVLESAS